MDAKQLIRANRLFDARSRLVDDVKASPADTGSRVLLFQVLSFLGEWDKADRQLDILSMGNSRTKTGSLVFKDLIAAERKREKVAAGEERPDFLADAPPCLEQVFQAREKIETGCPAEGRRLFEEAYSRMPEVSGVLDGRDFAGFRNIDAFLSGFLEVFIHDRYIWVPFESLRELTIHEPKPFLDLLWIPASLTTWEGLTTGCYLPVSYPCSSAHKDELVCLGKKTVWQDLGEGLCKGGGQHVFSIGDEEKAMLEIRDVRFAWPAER